MLYYKCPNCKKVFFVDIMIDLVASYPSMPCPKCGCLSPSVPFSVYLAGLASEKIKTLKHNK